MHHNSAFWNCICRLRSAFIRDSHIKKYQDKKPESLEPGAVENDKPPNGRFKKSNPKYIRHDTLKVKVYAYQNPQVLNRVDMAAPWYQEHKVVETGKYWVVVLTNGYRVKYTVQVYTFKGIPNNSRKLQELLNHLRKNPKRAYSGWLHHANVYWQVSRQFKEQIKVNFFL